MSDRGQKRIADGNGGTKAAKRGKFFSQAKDISLPLNTKGLLISCITGKEAQAAQEAQRVLNTYYEESLPKTEEFGGSLDISSLIDSEIADLKNPKKQIFTYHKTGLGGLLYITMAKDAPGPGPVALVMSIGEDVKRTRQSKTRFCMRFTPVEQTCKATLDRMAEIANEVVLPHFKVEDGAKGRQFAVHYEHRASTKMDRLKVINAVLTGVQQPPHKANLGEPEITILVQVVRGYCAIAVVPKFKDLAKFNFSELSNTAPNPKATVTESEEKPQGCNVDLECKNSSATQTAETLSQT